MREQRTGGQRQFVRTIVARKFRALGLLWIGTGAVHGSLKTSGLFIQQNYIKTILIMTHVYVSLGNRK